MEVCCKVYKSKTYGGKLLQNLYDLWQAGHFCDVEICCEDEIFKVHKSVLASSSSYFRAMFTTAMLEEKQRRIELKTVSSITFSTLLTFIYTGEVIVSSNTVQEILSAADMLGLTEVVEFSIEYLKSQLHSTNSIGIYRFAENHHCIDLEKYSLEYIHRHFPDISELDEFLESPRLIVLQILRSEKLKIDSEYQVLKAAVNWLNYDLPNRKPYTFEILKNVRFPLIPSSLLKDMIDSTKDQSIKVALRCLQTDVLSKRGSLANLTTQPRKSAKKHIYVFGGSRKQLGSGWKQLSESTLDSVVCFDTFQKSWSSVSPMRIERILPGVAAMDGLIYVIGGEQESKILANGEVYNPQEDEWKKMEPMIIPRCAFGLAAWENYLFAFGGWVGEDIGGTIERYDPDVNEWTMIGNMEEPRFSMGVCSFEGLIYIVGGCTHTQRHLKDLCSYNPVTKEWTTLRPMKFPRSQMGIALLDKHMYVIGGISKHTEVLKTVEKYNFDTNEWTEVASLSEERANPAVGAVDGKIYCIGGDQTIEQNFFRAQVTLSSVEVYDPLTDTWESCEDIKESRSESGYVVI